LEKAEPNGHENGGAPGDDAWKPESARAAQEPVGETEPQALENEQEQVKETESEPDWEQQRSKER
jgi:hypothetical protein